MNEINFIDFINISHDAGIGVVVGKNVKSCFPRHVHESYCIGIVDSGARLIEENKNSHLVREKEVFILNPDMPHQSKTVNRKGHSYRVLSIKPHVMECLVSQMDTKCAQPPTFQLIRIGDKYVFRKIRNFFDLILEDDPLEKETAFLSILTEIIAKYSKNATMMAKQKSQKKSVQKACDFIKSNYQNKITLAQLSMIACLNPVYFQKVFLKEKGITPNEFLLKIRIEKARNMLHQGAGIAEVSLATGFTDQSHFTRYFSRTMGITPGRYLKFKLINSGL
jgi:AraC-like DNA-binding protein